MFTNSINDFIFRNPISEEEFEEREEEFDERFGVEQAKKRKGPHSDELPFVEFVGADSRPLGLRSAR